MTVPIDLCLAGATGWAGSELARAMAAQDATRTHRAIAAQDAMAAQDATRAHRAIAAQDAMAAQRATPAQDATRAQDATPAQGETTPGAADHITLRSAVSRTHAGARLGDVLGEPSLDARVFATAAEALAGPCDVFFEYTSPDVAKANVLAALEAGAHVVIGTSGLTDDDYAEIGDVARAAGRGVLAVGNFALTVVLLQKFAETAARLIPQWEVIDYAGDGKPDAPSGTARELAARLAAVRGPEPTIPVADTVGERDARGATIAGTQVHSVRLPGYVIGAEVVFGLPDQRLTLRHDAGASARPYVDGALLAIRRVSGLTGLHRGLDTVLDL